MADLRIQHWLSIVPGLAIGLAIGLFITWVVWPVEYYDTDPVDLRPEHKEDYVVMIAVAYTQDDDPELAAIRLQKLGFEDARQKVLSLFQTYSEAGYEQESHSLARLAYGIGVEDVALLPYIATPTPTFQVIVSPTTAPTLEATIAPTTEPIPEPTATPTEPPPEPAPTSTQPPPEPTPTPLPPTGDVDFQLAEQRDLGCTTDWGNDYILVYLQDEHGRGLAGVQVIVSGPLGEDSFFTGLKPEVDPGFADFLVTAPGTYTVQVLDGESHTAEGITFIEDGCPTENPYHVWRVAFRRVAQ